MTSASGRSASTGVAVARGRPARALAGPPPGPPTARCPAGVRGPRAARPRCRSPAPRAPWRRAPRPAGRGGAGSAAASPRTCRSYAPESMNSASVSWSRTPHDQSTLPFAAHDLLHQVRGQHHPGQPQARAPGTCWPSRGRRPGPGRGPGARPPADGRSGTPRRSRPPGSARPWAAPSRRRRPAGRGAAGRRWGTGARASAAPRPRPVVPASSPVARPEFVDRAGTGCAGPRRSSRSQWTSSPYDSTATARSPRAPQHRAQQRQPVDEPGADDDALRVRVHPAGPRQVVGQRGAQLDAAARVAVAEGRRSGRR